MNEKLFHPMLASDVTDENRIKFPLLASQKLDGVRVAVQGGQLLTRSLKPIPNKNVQEVFAGLPEGLDGEMIVGDPTAEDAYRKTTSLVMSHNKPCVDVGFHVFDKYGKDGFKDRLALANSSIDTCANVLRILDSGSRVVLVQHVLIQTLDELNELEEAWLEAGHEGVMLRAINGPYKTGRSSENEGYLLKLKRFSDTEGLVIGFVEQNHNENVATKDNLGYTERSSKKEGMVPAGVLGRLDVRGLKDPFLNVEFGVGGGFTAKMRKDLWGEKDTLIGRIAKVKYFAVGSKDKPRFPVFLGWRDERDM